MSINKDKLSKILNDKKLNELINDINKMYNYIGPDHLNYWMCDGTNFSCYGCLNCSLSDYDFDFYIKNGPQNGHSLYFCDKCSDIFISKVNEISKNVKDKNLKNEIIKIYNRKRDNYIKSILTEEEKKKIKEWKLFYHNEKDTLLLNSEEKISVITNNI